jgi:hypothetical protein
MAVEAIGGFGAALPAVTETSNTETSNTETSNTETRIRVRVTQR